LGYVAPEQITQSYEVTRAADIWALGVVAWELVAGRRLFTAPTGHEASVLWNVVEGPIDDVAVHAPSLPCLARDMIHRCLERDPSLRPKAGREGAEVLGAVARDLGGTPRGVGAYVEPPFGAALAEQSANLAEAARAAPAEPQASPAQGAT